ncbi:Transcription initiation factor TFIID subunit 9 [Perkinsus chesapeaki]|uniref:Adenylate kinase isoenzyme 6 homolog n=1 Tax=Perkinsus chesapeaki TaxID=330153 RepID=A0A7J6MLS9_PERCH|nr:Transcription initiation factor TFIID subunit 9 [Perkinsus chesapeaki]
MYKSSSQQSQKAGGKASATAPAPIGLSDEILSNMAVGKVFKDATKRVNSIDFTSDGRYLIASSDDESVSIYDTEKGSRHKMLYSRKYGCDNIQFVHSGTNSALCSSRVDFDHSLRYWDLYENKFLRYFKGHTGPVSSLKVHPYEDQFLSTSLSTASGGDSTCLMWDLRKEKPVARVYSQEQITKGSSTANLGGPCATYDTQGLVFAVSSSTPTGDGRKPIAKVHMFDNRQFERGEFEAFDLSTFTQGSPLRSMLFSPCGKYLLCSTAAGDLFAIDSFSGRLRAAYKFDSVHLQSGSQTFKSLPERDGLRPTFSPDARYVLCGVPGGSIYIWPILSKAAQEQAMSEDPANVQACEPKPVGILKGHSGYPRCVKFSPTRSLIASAAAAVALWIPKQFTAPIGTQTDPVAIAKQQQCTVPFFMPYSVLVAGTPGVGKSTFSRELAAAIGDCRVIELGKTIAAEHLYSEWDDEHNCSIFDEEAVEQHLGNLGVFGKENVVVDFHSPDFLPSEWFDVVVVLRCSTEALWSRLEQRHYTEEKIKENVECEIFQTILDDCREHFGNEKVLELQSVSIDDIAKNHEEARGKGRRGYWGKGKGGSGKARPTEVESSSSAPEGGEGRKERSKGRRRNKKDVTVVDNNGADGEVGSVPGGKKAAGKGHVEWAKQNRYKGRRRGVSFNPTGSELVDTLLYQLEGKGSYDCMICMTKIGRRAKVWQCREGCWAIFHAKCIEQWAASAHSEFATFRCPGCQKEHTDARPISCYCEGGIAMFDSHSCGQQCQRKRACGHACRFMCHPGPCPPCEEVVGEVACHCGKEVRKDVKCHENLEGWSCGEVCGRLMPCGVHHCTRTCHAGECGGCEVVLKDVTCYCGKHRSDEIKCDRLSLGSWTCGDVCDKLLACGNHHCTLPCHAGPCPSCPLDPRAIGATRCACGKTAAVTGAEPRRSCVDPLPTCGKICAKPLPCGHLCPKKCHNGPCDDEKCEEMVELTCVCGKTRRLMPCWEATTMTGPMKCHKKCNALKSCGKHRCNVVCCPGGPDAHFCTQVCGKLLNCGKHHCDYPCHLGKCRPCAHVSYETQYCYCGHASRDPPIPCGTPPPYCDRPCSRPRSCGHPCPLKCHYGPCPLCTVLVDKECGGGHGAIRRVPCHVTNVSCGSPCGKMLPCGRHWCQRTCHGGPCLAEGKSCEQKCFKPRPSCGHPCNEVCHDGPCPNTKCKATVTVSCPCGRRRELRPCGLLPSDVDNAPEELECTKECEDEMRQAQLRLAFAFGDNTGSDEHYSGDLVSLAEKNAEWLAGMEKHLTTAVVQRPVSMTLPPIKDRERIQLLLDYAQQNYRLECIADADGVVTLHWVTGARRPHPTLSEVIAMEPPSTRLPYTIDFDPQACPRIVVETGSGAASLRGEVYKRLRDWLGQFRCRRDGRNLLIEFTSEKAAREAFRHLKTTLDSSVISPLEHAYLENA